MKVKMKNIIPAALALVIVALSVQIVEAAEIKGANVTAIRYTDPEVGKVIQVNQNHNKKTEWQEHSPNGIFFFKVAMIDVWSVYLWDNQRKMVMIINLHTKKVTYGAGDSSGKITREIGSYKIDHAQ